MVLLLVALASGMDGGSGSRRLPGVAVVVAEGTRRGGDVHRYVAHELSHGGLCGVRLPSSTGPAVAPRVPTTRLAARDTAPRSPSRCPTLRQQATEGQPVRQLADSAARWGCRGRRLLGDRSLQTHPLRREALLHLPIGPRRCSGQG
ncbi:hypothetical protein MTO96_009753 [Rhipicephalus appendiculatus]